MPRLNAEETHVACEQCDSWIERGTDFAVLLYFPDDEQKQNPIGPYCQTCMGKLKVCCDCNKAYFGSEIKYFNNGIWYCTSCADSKEMCSNCGTMDDVIVYKGKKMCKTCFNKKYVKCNTCGKTKTKSRSYTHHTSLNQARYSKLYDEHGHDMCDACFNSLAKAYKPKKVKECPNCSGIYSGSKPYCKECMRRLPKCHVCDEIMHQYRDIQNRKTGAYVKVCNKCQSKVKGCNGCGDIVIGSLYKKRGLFGMKDVCKECHSNPRIAECKMCLTYGKLDSNGHCNTCKGIVNLKCSGCGTMDINGGSSCRACSQDQCTVYNYSYRPQPIFHYTQQDIIEGDDCFLGFEDEMLIGCGKQTGLHDMYKTGLDHTKLNAKSDASISGTGYEVVSHPYTLRAIQEEKIDGIFTHSKLHSSCGMHVHISRTAIKSDTHLYKMVNFIHENEKFSDEIAGRKYTGYQKKLDKKASSIVKSGRSARYQRVNLQNKNTVEIRMFASAERKYKLMYRLEFCHALVYYTKDASIKACSGYAGFIRFIKMNKKRYPALNKFIGGSLRFWNN